MTLRARFRINQKVKYRSRYDAEWRDALVVSFSPGGNYVHVSTDVMLGSMAIGESAARKQLLAPGEDPMIVQLTPKQRELFERIRDGALFIKGADVRVARKLEKLGLVELEDNGFMPRDRSGRTDGEQWAVKLKDRAA